MRPGWWPTEKEAHLWNRHVHKGLGGCTAAAAAVILL